MECLIGLVNDLTNILADLNDRFFIAGVKVMPHRPQGVLFLSFYGKVNVSEVVDVGDCKVGLVRIANPNKERDSQKSLKIGLKGIVKLSF